MKRIVGFLAGIILSIGAANAAVEMFGDGVRYSGTGVNASDILFTTGIMTPYSACTLMSTTGSVNVFVSLDGSTFSTAALSLQDFGATVNDPVLSTTALRVYGFAGKYKKIRVLQNGATAANASLLCWTYGIR